MKTKTCIAIPMALVPLLAASAAAAANADGLYLGAGYGYSKLQSSNSDIRSFTGVDDGGRAGVDDDDSAFKVFVGYEYNRYFATEAFYTDLGKANLIRGGNVVDLESKAYGLSLVGKLPVTDWFELFAKAGMAKWETEAHGDLGNPLDDLDDNDGIDPVYGAGAQLHIQNWLLRAEYERFDFDSDYQLDAYTASVGWQF